MAAYVTRANGEFKKAIEEGIAKMSRAVMITSISKLEVTSGKSFSFLFRPDICPFAWILHVFVWISFHGVYYFKSCVIE
jgi:hypothetical protein